MNYQEITFSTMLAALKHHWRAWLMTIAVFALLGVMSAVLFAGGDVTAAGMAEPLEPIDRTEIEQGPEYYEKLFQAIQEKYADVELYISTLNGDTTVTEEQSKALIDLYWKKMVPIYKKVLTPLQEKLSSQSTLLVPPRYLDRLREDLEDNLLTAQQDILLAETAVDLLKNMEAPRTDNESVVREYAELLKQAASLGKHRVTAEICQRKLDQLENNALEIRQESEAFEEALEKALEEQEALLDEVYANAANFAKENHVNVLLENDEGGDLKVTLQHTHSGDSSEQTAPVLFLFCVLVGVCAGAFLAICLEGGALKRFQLQKKDC